MIESRKKGIIQDFLFVIILISLSIIFYCFFPWISNLNGDTGDGAYGMYSGLAQIIHNKEVPLWNPYLWGGLTSAGHPVAQAFYPIVYLVCTIGYDVSTQSLSYAAIISFTIIHTVIFAIGMYVLLNVCSLKKIVSFSISVAITFCGASLYQNVWPYIYSGMVYIPIFIAALILMMSNLNRKGLKYCALSAIALGLAGLASTSHGILFLIMTFGIVFLCYLWKNRKDMKKIRMLVMRCFLTGFMGIGLMAISLLPVIQFLLHAFRYINEGDPTTGLTSMGFNNFIKYSITLEELRNIFSYGGQPISVGIFIFCIALVGIFRKSMQKETGYWCGISIFGICFAYSLGIVIPNIIYYIPFFNQIRQPALYAMPAVIGLGIIAGYGLNLIYETSSKKKEEGVCGLTALVLIILITIVSINLPVNFNLGTFLISILILLLFVSDKIFAQYSHAIKSVLLVLMALLNFVVFSFSIDKPYTAKEAIEQVKKVNESVLNIIDRNNISENGRIVQWTSKEAAYPSNVWSVWGIGDAAGYMNPSYEGTMNVHLNWDLSKHIDVQNIQYIVCTTSEEESFLEWLKACGLTEIKRANVYSSYDANETTEIIVFENTERPGVAWFVEDCITYSDATDKTELNGIINNSEFNLFTQALVNSDTSEKALKDKYSKSMNSNVEIEEYNANNISIKTQNEEEGLLVTSEVIDKGWKVYIDGVRADILEVNTNFRGVVVPEGEHTVVFKYLPDEFVLGGIISAVSCLCIIIVFIYSSRSVKNKLEISI